MNQRLKSTLPQPEKAILIACDSALKGTYETEDSIRELAGLATATGVVVMDQLIQKRQQPDPRTYLGRGKISELKGMLKQLGGSLVIADDELTSTQLHTVEEALQVKVVDRSQVILDLFAARAQSKEGKIQVELAQLEYLLPRLVGSQRRLSRLGGGIGTRGPGETKLEMDRRLMRRRIHKLREELESIRAERSLLRHGRKTFFLVSLLGYTNAGKSSLFRALTGTETLVSSQLFSTLDPKIRRARTDNGILFSDTVGFIRKIPHHLFTAFRATLEEVQDADLLLLVVDGSDPRALDHLAVAKELMIELEIYNKPTITVINKLDLSGCTQQLHLLLRTQHPARQVSALTGEGVDCLMSEIKLEKERQRPDAAMNHAPIRSGVT
jgi:GTP-binding protein HflX